MTQLVVSSKVQCLAEGQFGSDGCAITQFAISQLEYKLCGVPGVKSLISQHLPDPNNRKNKSAVKSH